MDLISGKNIFLEENLKSKNEVLSRLSEISKELGVAISSSDVLKAYFEREDAGSTGMVSGFAIPHAKSKSILSPSILFIRNNIEIVDWETLDDSKVSVIISFLIPEGNSEEHLKTLVSVSRKLMTEENIEILKKSTDLDEIIYVLVG